MVHGWPALHPGGRSRRGILARRGRFHYQTLIPANPAGCEGSNLRESKHIPKDGIHVEDTIGVETGIDEQCSVENVSPNVTSWNRTGVFSRQGEGTLGRECHVFLHISSIVALTWSIIKLRQESLAGIQC